MIGSILDSRTNSSSKASGNSPGIIAVYGVFVIVAVLVYHLIAEGQHVHSVASDVWTVRRCSNFMQTCKCCEVMARELTSSPQKRS